MSLLLTPLSMIYKQAAIARSALYHRGALRSRRLNRPVISIGNLSAGGTGKTPLVALVAKLLLARGLKPAILTRGYRRRRGSRLVALAPSSARSCDPREAGDEPALLAADLPEVPIVICASRYEGGWYAEEHFHIDVHILDDGFQHLQLARDLDVVALDATQGFSDRALLPAGRLREPCSALGRAQIVVLTRTELGDPEPLDKAVRAIHPAVQIFRSHTRLASLIRLASGMRVRPEDFQDKAFFAFCAIGNPSAFFGDLERWAFRIAGRRAFPDHHVYTERETGMLMREATRLQASAFITTRKDVMNLPPGWKPGLDVYAGSIEIEIQNLPAFEQAVFSCCGIVTETGTGG